MTTPQTATVDITAAAPPESDALRAARGVAAEAGVPTVSHLGGAWLRWFAGVRPARDVVELGSGVGYSALWLLSGMHPRGMLTTIEHDPDRQVRTQRTLAAAGHAQRTRSICGSALTVLPKLADDAYDLVFVDADALEYPQYLPHVTRLLRPGATLAAAGILRAARGDVADEEAAALREFASMVRDDPLLDGQVLPVGDGMLVASKRRRIDD